MPGSALLRRAGAVECARPRQSELIRRFSLLERDRLASGQGVYVREALFRTRRNLV